MLQTCQCSTLFARAWLADPIGMSVRLASVWFLWIVGLVKADEEPATCQLQGTFERLPDKALGLPFCEQYSKCTCCRPTHVLAIKEEVAAMSLSPACLATTSVLKCRACDPQVGAGAKQAICLEFCERWYEDCRGDYFAFRELRGNLAPCSHGSLICSELQDLAENGADLCKKAGYVVESMKGVPCFDGTVPPESSCPSKDGQMDELWVVALLGVGLIAFFFVVIIGGAALSFRQQAQQLAKASKSSRGVSVSGASMQGTVPADTAQIRQRRLERFDSS